MTEGREEEDRRREREGNGRVRYNSNYSEEKARVKWDELKLSDQ